MAMAAVNPVEAETKCLLIGAAFPPGIDGDRERRMAVAVRNDLSKMVNFLAEQVWEVPLDLSMLVTSNDLLPASSLTVEGNNLYKKATMQLAGNGGRIRQTVKRTVKEGEYDEPRNIIIFFSGHGSMETKRNHKGESGVEHALEFPLDNGTVMKYLDRELTTDVEKSLRPGDNLYLVFHACHSEGMFHGWQLTWDQRVRGEDNSLSVALFASSSSELPAEWYSDANKGFVSVFTKSAKPGQMLHEIQSDIFNSSIREERRRNPGLCPVLVTVRPDVANQKFLITEGY